MELKIIDAKILERIKIELTKLLEKSKRFSKKEGSSWLDNQDVCQMLNISLRTLQTYRDKGVLAYSQIGHKCYYKKEDIEKMIEQRKMRL